MQRLDTTLGDGLILPVDRTAGDKIQLLVSASKTALTAILALTRHSQSSAGCGIGSVNLLLPAKVREPGGEAFVAAREAVNEAKKRDTRFALRGTAAMEAEDAEAFVDLLLQSRARRSAEGWEMYDLLLAGNSQAEAAKLLGITPRRRANEPAARLSASSSR